MEGKGKPVSFQDKWKFVTEHALPNRTWHWWWWLFFFENEKTPDKPLQLMILWGNRNYKGGRINDFQWKPKQPIVTEDGKSTFESVVASWFFDGEKMHDPLILENGKTESVWNDIKGRIAMESDRGIYEYSGTDPLKGPGFDLKVKNPECEINLKMGKWTDEMAKLVPTGRNFIGHMGYSMLKYRALSAFGTIRVGDKNYNVTGRAYFQKVRIASVTPCWYWGIIQWDNGSYLQYFMPHLGLPMLRQSYPHKSNMDWGHKYVSRTMNYYDAEEKREYLIHGVEVEKHYEDDMPVMEVRGRPRPEKGDDPNGPEIYAKMKAYGRCCWDIAQPALGPLWLGIFYNEYPAQLLDFKLKVGNRRASMTDMGKSYCNFEHSWGTI